MREIIKVLLNEGIEREDIIAICKYIKEEYEVAEGLTSTIAPKLAGPSKDGKEENMGTKIDRASKKHPHLTKIAQTIDGAVESVKRALQKKEPKHTSLDDALKGKKPAGTIFGKDMYSDAQIEDAKKEVN